MNLVGVAEEIQHRIIHIFGRDTEGRRATNAGNPKLDFDPNFRDYVWFYEVRPSKYNIFRPDNEFCHSSSMLTMVTVWELPIKLDGEPFYKPPTYCN